MPADPASPYAQTLGLTTTHVGGRLVFDLPFGDHLIGRPGFLHGGAIAGLLENAAWATLREALGDEAASFKPITITVDFLRGGKPEAARAAARIVRMGRRVAVMTASAWQQNEEDRPIAQAALNFLIVR